METVWRILPSVRPRERERFVVFLALGALMALAQTVGATAAESLFLARVGPAALPVTFVMASLFTMAASFVYAVRLGRERNDEVLIELLAIASVISAGVGVAAWFELPFSATALFVVQFAAQAILLNHFVELASDCFDRLAAKRITPLFAAGLSVGASAGGALAAGLSRGLPPEALVATWSLLLLGILFWVRRTRGRIRRWSPLGLEEDARSIEGVRSAARYLRRTKLGRLLVLSAVMMMLAATIVRLVYSETIVRAFPDERSLASFLGTYLALTNLAQVALPLWVVPWLIARLGVPTANLIHPLISFGSSLGLAVSQQLPTALAARVSTEVFAETLASPMGELMCEAIPPRLSARAGAFLEGVVMQASLAAGGAGLLLLEGVDPERLALVAAGAALIYLFAHVRMRRAYTASLVTELSAGRLDLDAVGGGLGRGEVSRLATLWEQLRIAPDERALRTLVELAPFLAARGYEAPLLEGLEHPSPRLRAACLAALSKREAAGSGIPPAWLVGALRDPDAGVRLAALEALPADAAARDLFAARLRALEQDPDPAVAARAAARLGPAGEPVLKAMVEGPDAARAAAALEVLPRSLAAAAMVRCDDPDKNVRAAVLRCAARHTDAALLGLPQLLRALDDPAVQVRAAAVAALAANAQPGDSQALAVAFYDGSSSVRAAAVDALVARGQAGAAAAAERLSPEEPRPVREAALEVLCRLGSRDTEGAVAAELRRSVRSAWEALLALRVIPMEGPLPLRWLRAAESDALASAVRLAFHVLALLEDAAVTRAVERTIRFGPQRLRFEALEVLSNLGERDAAAKLVLLLESTALEEKLAHLGGFVRPPDTISDVVNAAREGYTRWLRWAARAASGVDVDPSKEGLMERLVFLRGVKLFSNLTLDQLESIERIASEEPFVEGERVVREGDPGDQLYLLMEGEVSVWRGLEGDSPQRLNTLGPGSYFGEMSVLDQRPRSASVLTNSESRLLVLQGERLRDLILEQPEIAFEMFRVLTARVRAAEERLPG